MFKKIQFALVAAAAMVSFSAGSAQGVAQWWTDHEPNHIILADAVQPDGWWTDHEPNHIIAPNADVPDDVIIPEWWTDHEPNH